MPSSLISNLSTPPLPTNYLHLSAILCLALRFGFRSIVRRGPHNCVCMCRWGLDQMPVLAGGPQCLRCTAHASRTPYESMFCFSIPFLLPSSLPSSAQHVCGVQAIVLICALQFCTVYACGIFKWAAFGFAWLLLGRVVRGTRQINSTSSPPSIIGVDLNIVLLSASLSSLLCILTYHHCSLKLGKMVGFVLCCVFCF